MIWMMTLFPHWSETSGRVILGPVAGEQPDLLWMTILFDDLFRDNFTEASKNAIDSVSDLEGTT
jgi:hypothetical protein